MYDSLWADWYLPAAMPALEKLVFSRVPNGARILDVCCGSGHVTTELVRRGYSVTGVDASAALRWVLPGSTRSQALRLRDEYARAVHELIAPSHFSGEIASALDKRAFGQAPGIARGAHMRIHAPNGSRSVGATIASAATKSRDCAASRRPIEAASHARRPSAAEGAR